MSPRGHPWTPERSAGPAAFFDPAIGVAAAWDVWVTLHAGPAHVERLARGRLHELVAFARERSPFYRGLYRGLPADDLDLSRLPVVTKHTLMEQFDQCVTDPAVTYRKLRGFLADPTLIGRPFLGRYAVWTTSGTTGEPGIFLHDGRALSVYDALEMVRFRRLTSTPALVTAAMANDRYALLAATGGHFAGYATLERLCRLYPWVAAHSRVFSIVDSIASTVARLNAFQPTLLATYPTAASLLAEEQAAGRLALRLREIWTGGECLSEAQRAQLTEVFGCRVRDGYGASECLSIAWDCGHGALHLNSDWIVLEPVDESLQPVPTGVPSHSVLLTNLANRVQPLIRYDLGDSVTLLDAPCACGSVFPALRVAGRADDVIAVQDASGRAVKLIPLALTTVIEDEAGVYRFQLLQEGPAALRLRLDPAQADAAKAQRCREALERFMRVQGVSNVVLEVERCDLQPHPVSGKLRRVIAQRAIRGRARAYTDRPARAADS